ncbi:MAG: XdhC family protein [Bacteroidota bacterium]
MKALLQTIDQWMTADKSFAMATVLKTWGSAPRPVGSTMLIAEDMEMAGSVSGGCVEGAVIREALPVIQSGESRKLAFGVSDEAAWSVGLSCGGKMEVFVERCPAFDQRVEERAAWRALQEQLRSNVGGVLLSKMEEGPGHHTLVLPDGTTEGQPLEEALLREALRAYGERKTQIIEMAETRYFARVYPPRSKMIIIGAAHITVDLVRLAQLYDFETIVIDPRGIFTNKTQFPVPPDQIFENYPAEVLNNFTLDAYTYAIVLSHDPKIDDNALHLLLPSEVAYIGALGSRRTHDKRVRRLREAGFSEEAISRIHAPVGVDIKAKRPNEIALSIMGEVIGVKNAYL